MISQELSDKNKERDIKLIFGLDANRSFVHKNMTKFLGLRVGVELKKKHRFGIGLYGMQDPIILTRKLDEEKYPNSNDSVYFNFGYSSLFYEYVWYRTKRWELSSPFNFGGGEVDLNYRDTLLNKRVPIYKGNINVLVGSGAVEFKLTRWLALGAGAGYRFVFSRDENLREGLNAPIYVYRVKLLMGEILKMWFKKDYVNEEWD